MPVILTRLLSNQQITEFASMRNSSHSFQLCGFIIVRTVNNTCIDYISHLCTLNQFGDETRAEDPKTYLDMTILSRALGRYKRKYDYMPGALESAIWLHPEFDYQPLDKYKLMDGVQFAGCPRK